MAGEVVSQVYEEGKAFNLIVRTKDEVRDEMEKVRNLMIDTGEAAFRSMVGMPAILNRPVGSNSVPLPRKAARSIASAIDVYKRQILASVPP